MATKNILLAVADLQTVADINKALGDEWVSTHVTNEPDALALLDAGPFEAIVVDFNIGSPDASDLLNQALEKCPNSARYLFAYEADLALVAAKVNGEHEILAKPIDPTSLKNRIAEAATDPIAAEAGTATGFDMASSIPTVYDEVLKALESPEVTSRQIGEIIARDGALTEETLKLTRSAYLGLPGKITKPAEAVEVLGLDTVKALVMALKFLAEHSHVRPGYLSLETIWQHSISVGQIARDLVLFETKDRAMAQQALAAGLLHDLGKVVLATNFEDLYGRVHALARKQPVALWEIEKEMFGANHGEIGACLLGMWNLGGGVVEAATYHHEPPVGERDHLTPLAAVHIANVLVHQLRPADEFRVVPVVSAPFLNQLGLLQRIPVWRATFANQLAQAASTASGKAQATEGAATSGTANELQGPVTDTLTGTEAPAGAQPRNAGGISRTRLWVYTGVAAVVMFSLGLISPLQLGNDAPVRVHARALASLASDMAHPSDPADSTIPVLDPAPEQQVVADASSEMAAAENNTFASEAAFSQPGSESNPETVSAAVVTLPAAPTVASKEMAKPAYRLNGVFYTASNPSAIVNGKTVFVGEKVNGAMVVSISRDTVTLAINGEEKTISVPGANGHF